MPAKKKGAAATEPAAPEPSVNVATQPPVSASVTHDLGSGLWAVDVNIGHGDQTVVRVNGRAVWVGTP